MNKSTIELVKKALKAYKVKGQVRINYMNEFKDRVLVMVNDKAFGIFDIYKNTFVA